MKTLRKVEVIIPGIILILFFSLLVEMRIDKNYQKNAG
jgi:hypothetical protein